MVSFKCIYWPDWRVLLVVVAREHLIVGAHYLFLLFVVCSWTVCKKLFGALLPSGSFVACSL